MLIEQSKARYLRTPRLRRTDSGAELCVIAWQGQQEHLLFFDVDLSGQVTGETRETEGRESIVCLEHGLWPPAISEDINSEDRCSQQDWSVRISRSAYQSSVWLKKGQGKEILVWQAEATACAPCLAPWQDGVWVAFHHNLREDTGEADISKWISLRYVDSEGQVYKTRNPMRDYDVDREGIEQGFEFPSLVVAESGALSLYGRGSHCFWKQDLSHQGWSARKELGEGSSWGCRGRRVALTSLDNGKVLSARRERKGIELEIMSMPEGAAPELERVEVVEAPAVLSRGRFSIETDPAELDGRKTLFGDLHQHSAHSDGCGNAEEAYLRAQYIYQDDFVALTDHESFLGKRIGPGEWRYLTKVAEKYNKTDRFVTINAYEWTAKMFPGPGHKIVYFPGAGQGTHIVSRDEVPEGKDILREVAKQGAFAAPHHVGWTGANLEAHDPQFQPVWEICSCHGCYEHADHPLGQRGELRDQMVHDALVAGHRFGLVACSDGHGLLWHHGVGRKRDPFRTGLTAVQAKEHTRQGVFEAIRERRCYATSGAKIVLDLRANGLPMGSELDSSEEVEYHAQVWGTSPIRRLALVGPTGIVESIESKENRAEIRSAKKQAFVYARVEQEDGEMAWSSPIFLN